MSEEQQQEEVTLTEEDQAVIDEINQGPEDEINDSFEDESSFEEEPGDHTDSEDSEEEGPQFNPDLAQAAEAFGIDTNLYESEDQLRGAIEATKQFARIMQPQQQPAPQEQPQEPEQQQPQVPEFKFDLGEDVDPELQDKFNKGLQSVVDHFQAQQELLAQHVLQQQQVLSQQYAAQQQEEQQRIFNEWDRAVQGLERSDRYGKGSYDELSKASHRSDRDRLGQQVSILATGYQQQGLQTPPMDELVKQADRMLFAEDYEKMARKQVNERIKKQAQRTTKTGKRSQRSEPVPDDPVNNPALIEWWEENVG